MTQPNLSPVPAAPAEPTQQRDHLLSNGIYNKLKFIAMILLPAAGTCYAAVAALWGLPASEQVVGTIVAVDTFLGVLLGVSTTSYNSSDAKYDGTIVTTDTPTKTTYSIELNDDPEALKDKDQVVLSVAKGLPPQAV